jgi:hypothetical protein
VGAGRSSAPSRLGWTVATFGALAVVTSFCWRFRDVMDGRTPGAFPAALFWPGLAIAAAPFVRAALAAFVGPRSSSAASDR